MKKLIYFVFFIICFCPLKAQTILPVSDFESYDTTPYFFRYGNKGNQYLDSYKPRWIYSHEVVDNFYPEGNSSSKILRYMSMEARNYGLKFRFVVPPAVDELKSVSFIIYQPANVIGKSVDTQYNSGQQPATVQKIAVKLLADYSSICDFRSEDGLIVAAQEFTKENEWVAYKFIFDKDSYASSVLDKFKDGIKGIAILPTYNSNVTLTESNPYVCFIDDIDINETLLGISTDAFETGNIYYAGGRLFIQDMQAQTEISVYNISGVLIERLTCEEATGSIPLSLSDNRPYIVKVRTGGKTYQRIIYP